MIVFTLLNANIACSCPYESSFRPDMSILSRCWGEDRRRKTYPFYICSTLQDCTRSDLFLHRPPAEVQCCYRPTAWPHMFTRHVLRCLLPHALLTSIADSSSNNSSSKESRQLRAVPVHRRCVCSSFPATPATFPVRNILPGFEAALMGCCDKPARLRTDVWQVHRSGSLGAAGRANTDHRCACCE